MKKARVQKVWAELHRTIDTIKALDEATKADKERWGSSADYYPYSPRETGALRRASMDLSRALAEMRKSDYA